MNVTLVWQLTWNCCVISIWTTIFKTIYKKLLESLHFCPNSILVLVFHGPMVLCSFDESYWLCKSLYKHLLMFFSFQSMIYIYRLIDLFFLKLLKEIWICYLKVEICNAISKFWVLIWLDILCISNCSNLFFCDTCFIFNIQAFISIVKNWKQIILFYNCFDEPLFHKKKLEFLNLFYIFIG